MWEYLIELIAWSAGIRETSLKKSNYDLTFRQSNPWSGGELEGKGECSRQGRPHIKALRAMCLWESSKLNQI